MEFKDRIEYLRTDKRLSYTELGALFGKTESATRAWELGRSKPDADTLIKLAEYFNCTTDYLLGISDSKNSKEKKVLDEFINLIKKSLTQLNEEHLGITKICIQYVLNIWNRKDIASPMASEIIRTVYLFVSTLDDIMDDMSQARMLSRGDSINEKQYFKIMQHIMHVYNMEESVNQNIEELFRYIVNVPACKIKESLENAGYNIDFIATSFPTIPIIKNTPPIEDRVMKRIFEGIDYHATQE